MPEWSINGQVTSTKLFDRLINDIVSKHRNRNVVQSTEDFETGWSKQNDETCSRNILFFSAAKIDKATFVFLFFLFWRL